MSGSDNDDFLVCLRESPHPEFAATLYARINEERRPQMLVRVVMPVARYGFRYVAALCVIFGVVAGASPDVRAGTLEAIQRLRQIGGTTIIESNQIDGTHRTTSPGGVPKSVANIQRVGVAEARERVPYAFSLPTWMPTGAVMTDQVEVVNDASLIMYWTANGQHSFILRTYPPGGGTGHVGHNSAQEVTVNGRSALLIRGMWDGATGQWSRPQFVTLHWSLGGVTYELLANTDVGASESDLLRVAESIR